MKPSAGPPDQKDKRRFEFGENWRRFLEVVDDLRIADAERSLRDMLHVDTLAGKRLLDAGSGSGLFSLAARRLGAIVHSFDYDPQSVACTEAIKQRYYGEDDAWTVEHGSVLDKNYLAALGHFDIVYCWGVLHHTGHLWVACEQIINTVSPGGQLFIAIYNDQGVISRYWSWVKRSYNRNPLARFLLTALHVPYLLGAPWLVRSMRGKSSPERGMSRWHDVIDWLGGYPFEVAKPETVFSFFQRKGFVLETLKTCGGRMGCNEFVFRRTAEFGTT